MAYRAVRHRGERAPAQPSLSKGHLSGSRNPDGSDALEACESPALSCYPAPCGQRLTPQPSGQHSSRPLPVTDASAAAQKPGSLAQGHAATQEHDVNRNQVSWLLRHLAVRHREETHIHLLA